MALVGVLSRLRPDLGLLSMSMEDKSDGKIVGAGTWLDIQWYVLVRRRVALKNSVAPVKTADAERRAALIELGAEILADTLIRLAPWSHEVDETIERLVSNSANNVSRFKHRLSNLSCLDEFVDWRRLNIFVRELEFLLAELKASVTDGRTGFELVVFFFNSEQEIFANCDDDGSVGSVFQNDAVELLAYFGSRCDDKDWLCDELMHLYQQDLFGVRSKVFDNVAQYLPEEHIRQLIARLQLARQQEPKDYERRRWSLAIESLARQLKEPEIFEQARRWGRQSISPEDALDIAQMWFDCGDAETALSLLQEFSAVQARSHRCSKLLLAIHEKLGNKGKQATIAWRLFKEHRSEESLQALLQVIGGEQRNLVIKKQAKEILSEREFSYTDAAFLISCGLLDEAEKYIWERASQLRGDFYFHVLPLAQAMETNRRFLTATILYRSLLDAILARAYAKAYHHGVDYLRKLEAMAEKIKLWQDMVPHAGYIQELRISHGRKSSFWGQYEHQ